jgi:hypothetical protein
MTHENYQRLKCRMAGSIAAGVAQGINWKPGQFEQHSHVAALASIAIAEKILSEVGVTDDRTKDPETELI